VQKVKGEIDQAGLVAAEDGGLEVVKVRNPSLVWCRDLAIEHDLAPEFGERTEDRPELLGSLVAVPGQETDLASPSDDGEAVPVVLYLVEPAIADWRISRRGGELKSDTGREWSNHAERLDRLQERIQLRRRSTAPAAPYYGQPDKQDAEQACRWRLTDWGGKKPVLNAAGIEIKSNDIVTVVEPKHLRDVSERIINCLEGAISEPHKSLICSDIEKSADVTEVIDRLRGCLNVGARDSEIHECPVRVAQECLGLAIEVPDYLTEIVDPLSYRPGATWVIYRRDAAIRVTKIAMHNGVALRGYASDDGSCDIDAEHSTWRGKGDDAAIGIADETG
jgi:hypothetical protein